MTTTMTYFRWSWSESVAAAVRRAGDVRSTDTTGLYALQPNPDTNPNRTGPARGRGLGLGLGLDLEPRLQNLQG